MMKHYLFLTPFLAGAALVALPTVAQQAAPASAPASNGASSAGAGDAYSSLPPGPGRDVEIRVCSACHSPDIVADQRMTPSGWHDLVDSMAANGAQASDAEFTAIEQYLSKSFPADAPQQ